MTSTMIEAARHARGIVLGWQAARVDYDLAEFEPVLAQAARPLVFLDQRRALT
jgi:hypothetical protein